MQAAKVAGGLVETHQPVDRGNLGKRVFAGGRCAQRIQPLDAQLDQRAERWPHAPDYLATHPAAPLDAALYTFSKRCTPSVTWRHESVAPEIFLMSLFNSSGSAPVFPTNCLRQPARRISPPCASR